MYDYVKLFYIFTKIITLYVYYDISYGLLLDLEILLLGRA